MRTSLPFCVLERPFVVWSDDVGRDCEQFLTQVDVSFYSRAAEMLIGTLPDEALEPETKATDPGLEFDQHRKDIASFSRLLWHHGIETLVTMLGAFIQAPSAVHAYFLKCRTEDTVGIARALLEERRLRHNRINDVPFTLENILGGLHRCAPWTDREDTIDHFAAALRQMLAAYVGEEHRWEYNSIKHGLRAKHGRFALAVGLEESYGVEPPPEAMKTVGYSRDASFFNVAKPLRNAGQKASKVNFKIETVTLSWSLEKVLCELQLLSLLLGNTVSALRIAAGAAPGTVRLTRPADPAWWGDYFELHAGSVPTASFGIDIDAQGIRLPAGKDVLESYATSKWSWW
jgi:hypothetical protein